MELLPSSRVHQMQRNQVIRLVLSLIHSLEYSNIFCMKFTVQKRFPENFSNRTAKGITNKGLWCYRNSIIQALVHVPGLFGYFSTHDRDGGDKCKLSLLCKCSWIILTEGYRYHSWCALYLLPLKGVYECPLLRR